MTFRFEDGKEYSARVDEDMFMRAYLMDMMSRRSCYDCKFRQVRRESDITLADFWGVEKIIPEFADDKGTTLLLIHSEKGASLINRISSDIILKKTGYSFSTAHNKSATQNGAPSPARDRFIKTALDNSFIKAYNKYCGSGLWPRLRRYLLKRFKA